MVGGWSSRNGHPAVVGTTRGGMLGACGGGREVGSENVRGPSGEEWSGLLPTAQIQK